jgi:hypothetical protein
MPKANLLVELVFVLGLAASASGQVVPAVNQTAEKSSCSNIVALSGAKVDGSNLTSAQQKALTNMPAIMKMTLENQDYLNAIIAKLEEMSKAQSAPTIGTIVQGPCGVVQNGGSNNTASPNCGPPEPEIKGIEHVPSDPPFDANGHPLTTIKFYLTSMPISHRFYAMCDRPCVADWGSPYPRPPVGNSSDVDRLSSPSDPRVVGWQINTHLEALQYIAVSVVSQDNKPVSIIHITQKIVPPKLQ